MQQLRAGRFSDPEVNSLGSGWVCGRVLLGRFAVDAVAALRLSLMPPCSPLSSVVAHAEGAPGSGTFSSPWVCMYILSPMRPGPTASDAVRSWSTKSFPGQSAASILWCGTLGRAELARASLIDRGGTAFSSAAVSPRRRSVAGPAAGSSGPKVAGSDGDCRQGAQRAGCGNSSAGSDTQNSVQSPSRQAVGVRAWTVRFDRAHRAWHRTGPAATAAGCIDRSNDTVKRPRSANRRMDKIERNYRPASHPQAALYPSGERLQRTGLLAPTAYRYLPPARSLCPIEAMASGFVSGPASDRFERGLC